MKVSNTKKPYAKSSGRLKLWFEGARLRTLPLAVAPVLIGSGAAAALGKFDLLLSLLALTVSLALTIGVNFANDYSDGIRGTDDFRVGPLRLTGSKSVKPEAVKFAAFAFFGLAALAGLLIVVLTQHWWFLAIGAAAIVAAWFYTGGKNPYGYAGLGEFAVFVFFGLVASYGTAFIQIGFFDFNAIIGGTCVGLLASAVLMVNNIRDRETDLLAGKRTLAVKLGSTGAKALYLVMIWLPLLIVIPVALLYPAVIFAWVAFLFIAPLTLIVATAKTARELILALKLTSFAALTFAVFFGLGLAAPSL